MWNPNMQNQQNEKQLGLKQRSWGPSFRPQSLCNSPPGKPEVRGA